MKIELVNICIDVNIVIIIIMVIVIIIIIINCYVKQDLNFIHIKTLMVQLVCIKNEIGLWKRIKQFEVKSNKKKISDKNEKASICNAIAMK